MTIESLINWIQNINHLLLTGRPAEASREAKSKLDLIARLPPEVRLQVFGELTKSFDTRDRPTDAILYAEHLVNVARHLQPDKLATARDMTILGKIYGQLDRPVDQEKTLIEAIATYNRLSTAEQTKLEPNEISNAQLALDRAQTVRASRTTPPKMPDDPRTTLAIILKALEKNLPQLTQFPEIAVQQLYNHLFAYTGQTLVADLKTRFHHQLHTRDRGWVELKQVCGPGHQGWRMAQNVRTNEFPEEISNFVVLPNGRFFVVTKHGSGWLAALSSAPEPIGFSTRPREKACHLANCGSTVGYIDVNHNLVFLRSKQERLIDTGVALEDICALIAKEDGFVAAGNDGTIHLLDAAGHCTKEFKELALTKSNHLACSMTTPWFFGGRSSTEHSSKSQFRVVDLSQSRIIKDIEVDFTLLAVATHPSGRQILLGATWGIYSWGPLWEDPPKELARTAASRLAFSSNGRYLANAVSNRVIVNDLQLGLASSIGHQIDAFSCIQLGWSGKNSDSCLHIGAGRVITTWKTTNFPWTTSARIMSPIECALFDETGEHFAGVGSGGEQYYWEIATGRLLQFEKGTNSATPYIVWSPGRKRGACCDVLGVEVLDRNGDRLEFFPACGSTAACWDRYGDKMAYLSTFEPGVTVASFRGSAPNLSRIPCQDNRNACAIALSPSGRILGVAEAFLRRPIAYGMSGMGANVKTNDPFGRPERISVIDLQTGDRRCLQTYFYQPVMGMHFLSEDQLIVWDDVGAFVELNLNTDRVTNRWVTGARCVGMKHLDEDVLVADSGEGPGCGPIVYQIKFNPAKK